MRGRGGGGNSTLGTNPFFFFVRFFLFSSSSVIYGYGKYLFVSIVMRRGTIGVVSFILGCGNHVAFMTNFIHNSFDVLMDCHGATVPSSGT